jgi:hypothetical protein
VKTAHFHPTMCNLPHCPTTHGSPTIYRCFALQLLLYRWRHQSKIFYIPSLLSVELGELILIFVLLAVLLIVNFSVLNVFDLHTYPAYNLNVKERNREKRYMQQTVLCLSLCAVIYINVILVFCNTNQFAFV